jgi:hypothetical protein
MGCVRETVGLHSLPLELLTKLLSLPCPFWVLSPAAGSPTLPPWLGASCSGEASRTPPEARFCHVLLGARSYPSISKFDQNLSSF